MVSRGPRGEGAAAVISLGPGRRRQVRPGGCNTRCPAAASHLPAEALPADPEPVAAHRLGGNAPDGGRGRPGGGPRSTPAPPEGRGRGGSVVPGRPTEPAGLNPPGRLRGPHPFTS